MRQLFYCCNKINFCLRKWKKRLWNTSKFSAMIYIEGHATSIRFMDFSENRFLVPKTSWRLDIMMLKLLYIASLLVFPVKSEFSVCPLSHPNSFSKGAKCCQNVLDCNYVPIQRSSSTCCQTKNVINCPSGDNCEDCKMSWLLKSLR